MHCMIVLSCYSVTVLGFDYSWSVWNVIFEWKYMPVMGLKVVSGKNDVTSSKAHLPQKKQVLSFLINFMSIFWPYHLMNLLHFLTVGATTGVKMVIYGWPVDQASLWDQQWPRSTKNVDVGMTCIIFQCTVLPTISGLHIINIWFQNALTVWTIMPLWNDSLACVTMYASSKDLYYKYIMCNGQCWC